MLEPLGLRWPYDTVVYDPYNPYPVFGDQVSDEYLFVSDRDDTDVREINPDSPITAGLDQVLLAYAGSVSPADGRGGSVHPAAERPAPAAGRSPGAS